MKLLFKQRFFSFFDSYDVYDADGNVVYTVKERFAFGKHLEVFDAHNNLVGAVKQELFTFRPKYALYTYDEYIGCITKEFTFFTPEFNIDLNGWHIEGDFAEWDYQITDYMGKHIADASKELFNFTDTYTIDVPDKSNTLAVLLIVLTIDAEKDNRN